MTFTNVLFKFLIPMKLWWSMFSKKSYPLDWESVRHISVRSCLSSSLFPSDDLELELDFLECLELSELELDRLELVSFSTFSSASNAACSKESKEVFAAIASSFRTYEKKSSMNWTFQEYCWFWCILMEKWRMLHKQQGANTAPSMVSDGLFSRCLV